METLYDERGAQYKLPIFTFSNPVELVWESVPEGAQASPVVAVALSANTSGKGVSNKSGTATPVVHAEPLQLKIRINPGRRSFFLECNTFVIVFMNAQM